MTLIQGDAIEALERLVDEGQAFDCCLTSPPYFTMADYELPGQFGLEDSVEDYLAVMVKVFGLVYRLLPMGGVCWIVIGDTSNNKSAIRRSGDRKKGVIHRRRKLQRSHFEKEPLNVPHRLAQALRASGWRHRNSLIWDKGSTNSVANSDTGSCTLEYILQMGKWPRPGRLYANSSAWQGSIIRFPPAGKSPHRCPFPLGLADFLLSRTIASSVIDPFIGSGTTAIAANALGMSWAGIDLDISLAQSLLPEEIAA